MFEHSLIELETKRQPRSRRRWLSLPIAVALHLVALMVFVFGSTWAVGKVKPVDVVTFVMPRPLPASEDGDGRPKPPQPRPQTRPEVKPDKPVQPTADTVPDKPPVPTADPPMDDFGTEMSTTDSTGKGYGNGDGKGDGNGIGLDDGSDHTPIANDGVEVPKSEDDLPIRLSVGMTRPEPIRKVEPRYTQAAQRAGLQGSVMVEAVIDEQGRVTDVRVLHGLPLGLDRNAVEAIQQWRFKPALRGDKPVKVYFTLTVIFSLKR